MGFPDLRRAQGKARRHRCARVLSSRAMSFRRVLVAVTVASLAFLGTPDAPATTQPKLGRIVRALVADGAPGSLAVVRTPTRVVRAASGYSDRELRLRMRPTDRFRIASVTKTFVATVVLQLVAEGRLRLDDTVESRLPSLVPNGSAITIRELLNHTSGLFDYSEDAAYVDAVISNPGREWSPRELVAVASAHPPLFAPGSAFSYSNTNYIVLGLIVESVTREPIGDTLRRGSSSRSACAATSFSTSATGAGRVAHGYVVSVPPLPFPPGTFVDTTPILSGSHGWAAGSDSLQRGRRDEILRRAPRRPASPAGPAGPDEAPPARLRARAGRGTDAVRPRLRPQRRVSGLPERRPGDAEGSPRRRRDGERRLEPRRRGQRSTPLPSAALCSS